MFKSIFFLQIALDEWKHGSVICAHGFEPDEIETTYNAINLNVAG